MKYTINDVIKIERLDDKKFKRPTINVDLCFICNFKCSYCYARRDSDFNDPGDKKRIDLLLKSIKLLKFDFNVTILGGEPTLSKYLDYYLEELKNIGNVKLVTLITNCSIFPNLKNIDRVDCILASFHSEQIATEKYFENVLRYKKLDKDVRCSLVYKEQYKNKIDVLYNLCLKNDIKMYIDCGFDENNNFYNIDYNIYNNYKNNIFKTSRYYFKDGSFKDFYDYETIQNNLRCLDNFNCQLFEYTQSVNEPTIFRSICFNDKLYSFNLNNRHLNNHIVKCNKKLCTCQCMNIGDKVR